jgi:hypothetical protein
MPLARLEKWLGGIGIRIEARKVRIRATNGGLGVFTVSHVKKGDLLCTIPKAAVLSCKSSGIADVLKENRIRGASFCRTACPCLSLLKVSADLPYSQP